MCPAHQDWILTLRYRVIVDATIYPRQRGALKQGMIQRLRQAKPGEDIAPRLVTGHWSPGKGAAGAGTDKLSPRNGQYRPTPGEWPNLHL